MLHIQYNAITLILCRYHLVAVRALRQFEESGTVEPMQPREPVPDLIGMDTAPGDVLHIGALT